MVEYNGKNYDIKELAESDEIPNLLRARLKKHDPEIPISGPSIHKSSIEAFIKEKAWDPDEVVIIDDRVTNSPYKKYFEE